MPVATAKKTYNYYSATQFYPDAYVESLFTERGNWNRLTKEELLAGKKPVHFLHLNGKYILNKDYYSIASTLKNIVDNKQSIAHKDQLIANFQKSSGGRKYVLESYNLNAMAIMKAPRTLERYRDLFSGERGTGDVLYIFKPVVGFGGADIQILSSYAELVKCMTTIIKKWKEGWMRGSNYYKEWVLQEYLADPLLLRDPRDNKDYKFHIRHYFVFRPGNKKSFYLKKGFLPTALKPYKQGDWANKDIHDTHFYGRLVSHFPEDMGLTPYQRRKINKQLMEIYTIIDEILKKNAHCFAENVECFQIFGADIMVTKNYELKLLELNSSPGLAYEDRPEVQEEHRSVIENYMANIVDEYFPPAQPVENPYKKEVVFIG